MRTEVYVAVNRTAGDGGEGKVKKGGLVYCVEWLRKRVERRIC